MSEQHPNNYLIIGGSSGIGKALVGLLEEEGNNVFATYNNNAQENLNHIQYQKFNVLEDDFTIDWLPNEINGLAYFPGSINLKPFKSFNEEDFISDYRLQVLGAIKVIQKILPRFVRNNSSIVLFSTVAVQNGFAFHSQVSSSKGAIEGLTRSLAAELAPKTRVNAIAPSLTNTPLAGRLLSSPEKKEHHAKNNPLKKVGEANDVAQAAHFLLTEKSNWITGQIIHVDGGQSTLQ